MNVKKRIPFYLSVLLLMFVNSVLYSYEFRKSGLSFERMRHTLIMNHDLNGDKLTDIVLVNYRDLSILYQKKDKGFVSEPDFLISIPYKYSNFSFIDVSGDNSEELILFSEDGVWFDSAASSGKELNPKKMIDISLPLKSRKEILQYSDVAVTLSKDTFPAVVLPVNKGYVVFSQPEKGKFVKKWEISSDDLIDKHNSFNINSYPYPVTDTFFSGIQSYRFENFSINSALTAADLNNDGLTDFKTGKSLFIQEKDGKLKTIPYIDELLEDDDTEESDKVKKRRDMNMFATESKESDINGDGIADKLVSKTESIGFENKTKVEVYLGKLRDEDKTNIVYKTTPDSVLVMKGFIIDTLSNSLADINNDGKLDIAGISFKTEISSVSSQVKAFAERGVEGELQFFIWDKDKGYPSRPSFTRKIQVSLDITGWFMFNGSLIDFSSDFTGDQLPDLVLKTSKDEFSIFRFAGSGYAEKPEKTVKCDGFISGIECKELNNDGKKDIIIQIYNSEKNDIILNNFFISY